MTGKFQPPGRTFPDVIHLIERTMFAPNEFKAIYEWVKDVSRRMRQS
jgi:hypothetical protein